MTFTKWPYWERIRFKSATEPVLQTYEIPLSEFVDGQPDFDPALLQQIRFCFDRTEPRSFSSTRWAWRIPATPERRIPEKKATPRACPASRLRSPSRVKAHQYCVTDRPLSDHYCGRIENRKKIRPGGLKKARDSVIIP